MQTENATRRLALIFGNATYTDPDQRLKNTRKDAEDVGEKLRSLGFVVDDVFLDRDHSGMLSDIEDFTERMDEGVSDIVLYYAGHGCSISESYNLKVLQSISAYRNDSTYA